MNANASQVETVVETKSIQPEHVAVVEVIKELAGIELAYVGGGIASVSFI